MEMPLPPFGHYSLHSCIGVVFRVAIALLTDMGPAFRAL